MKDIDFLPEWYKSGIRREVGYRTQYIVLSAVFVALAIWCLAATRSISKARAELAEMSETYAKAESASNRAAEIESELKSLTKKLKSTEEIDSRINVADVLSEMSFLIEDGIVLKEVELIAERFPDEQQNRTSSRSGAVVRAARAKNSARHNLPLGNVRFKVAIAGVAASTRDVAVLVGKLEESPYFWQVVPSTRSAEVQVEDAGQGNGKTASETGDEIPRARTTLQVSKFAINCYLANYRTL